MVSVVIPTKDDEKIFRTIKEVKKQNPEEIIVVNDISSSEQYSKRLKEIEGVKYIELEGGTAEARNKGAEEASEDKILLLDSDCYPTKGWMEKMADALDSIDIAEGEVEYIGDRTPFSRIVENRGEEGRFLTANLGVRSEVFEEVKFDENYELFREDTDFGIRALNNGFESNFVEAKVEHDAGNLDFRGFIKDQLRYTSEPYFFNKFRDDEKMEDHLSHIGPVLYPLELAATAAIVFTIGLSIYESVGLLSIAAVLSALTSYRTVEKMKSRNARFSLKDWIKGLYYIPAGLFAKRYAIWKGSYKNKVLVV